MQTVHMTNTRRTQNQHKANTRLTQNQHKTNTETQEHSIESLFSKISNDFTRRKSTENRAMNVLSYLNSQKKQRVSSGISLFYSDNYYSAMDYVGLKSTIPGYFIQIHVNSQYLFSGEDFSLIPALLVSMAYKGMFRKYMMAISEYTNYSLTLFVEELGYEYTYGFLVNELTNRVRIMYPDRAFHEKITEIYSTKSSI